jgi:hypothetical protein
MNFDCAIIYSTSNQPMAAVILVNSSAFHNQTEREAARATLSRLDLLAGVSVVMATQISADRIEMSGDPSLVSQLSQQDWLLWDWRELTVS